jgi:simple sugar transport system substrate-binding protein
MGNIMGNMTWMKMMAGCAAGLATETGQIGYLGPLINHETRRLTNSVYLGAKYCYENFRGMDADDLTFTVTWIGFWFNIPGVTLDPTEETHRFFDNGADVVVSGIDTTEAIDVAGQRAAEGETVWAIPYDYEGSCSQAPEICLGVPYFNWGPAYVELVNSVIDGTWTQSWDWNDPYWPEVNNNDITSVGYVRGDALTDEMNAQLDTFLAGISAYATQAFSGPYIALWQGPLNWQDGTPLVVEGEVAAPEQVWWSPQLLEGMIGASVSE